MSAEGPSSQYAALSKVVWENLMGASLERHPSRIFENWRPGIFQIPKYIMESDPNAYTPRVVSIGPYHRNAAESNDVTLLSSFQDYKRLTVRRLLSLELLSDCLAFIMNNIHLVRKSYTEVIDMEDGQLAELMLLDGCFIVHFLRDINAEGTGGNRSAPIPEVQRDEVQPYQLHENMHGVLLGTSFMQKLVCYDLLKLENQIPWVVLEYMSLILCNNYALLKAKMEIVRKINSLIEVVPVTESADDAIDISTDWKPDHLLHLFRKFLITGLICQTPINERSTPKNDGGQQCHWVPRAIDLRMGGIEFRKHESSKSLLGIEFENGVLEIPPFTITDCTCTLFRNLIAYEQLQRHTRNNCITAYIVLMDCLAGTPKDVRLLERREIIKNGLNTDQAVIDLFADLKHHVPYTLDGSYLEKIFDQVNSFRKKRWRQQYASLKRGYFQNPWKAISVLAGGVLLVLTTLQTIYTVYSYYHPRH